MGGFQSKLWPGPTCTPPAFITSEAASTAETLHTIMSTRATYSSGFPWGFLRCNENPLPSFTPLGVGASGLVVVHICGAVAAGVRVRAVSQIALGEENAATSASAIATVARQTNTGARWRALGFGRVCDARAAGEAVVQLLLALGSLSVMEQLAARMRSRAVASLARVVRVPNFLSKDDIALVRRLERAHHERLGPPPPARRGWHSTYLSAGGLLRAAAPELHRRLGELRYQVDLSPFLTAGAPGPQPPSEPQPPSGARKGAPGAVASVALVHRGRVLLTRETRGGKTRLNLPGGKVEAGETLGATVAREG